MKYIAQVTLVLPNGNKIEKGSVNSALVGVPAEFKKYFVEVDDGEKADSSKDDGKKTSKKR